MERDGLVEFLAESNGRQPKGSEERKNYPIHYFQLNITFSISMSFDKNRIIIIEICVKFDFFHFKYLSKSQK